MTCAGVPLLDTPDADRDEPPNDTDADADLVTNKFDWRFFENTAAQRSGESAANWIVLARIETRGSRAMRPGTSMLTGDTSHHVCARQCGMSSSPANVFASAS